MLCCRRCGEPLERGWNICRTCGQSVTPWWRVRAEHNHVLAMFVAVFTFVISNAMMVELTARNPLGTGSMLARLWVLGLPLAVVAWNWWLLCRSEDPEYGYLWRNYCLVQWGVNFFSVLPLMLGRALNWL